MLLIFWLNIVKPTSDKSTVAVTFQMLFNYVLYCGDSLNLHSVHQIVTESGPKWEGWKVLAVFDLMTVFISSYLREYDLPSSEDSEKI